MTQKRRDVIFTEDQKSNPNLGRFPRLRCQHPMNELPLASEKSTLMMGRTLHAWHGDHQNKRTNAPHCSCPTAIRACACPIKIDNPFL